MTYPETVLPVQYYSRISRQYEEDFGTSWSLKLTRAERKTGDTPRMNADEVFVGILPESSRLRNTSEYKYA